MIIQAMKRNLMAKELPPFESMTGSLLVAMPQIEDPHFQRAVVYLTHHNRTDGARGIIINKPTDRISCQEILEQLKMPVTENCSFPSVLIGGPDHRLQGFILHTPEVFYQETQKITDDICLTTTQEILGEIALGHRPNKFLVAIGCASWAPSQMEEEIMGNLWLSVPCNKEILFDTPYEKKWEKAISLLGFSANQFSPKAGKA